MKNKLFSIILSIVLSLPIAVWAVDNAVVSQNDGQPIVSTLDEDVEEKSEMQYKEPISTKKIAKKFLAAMGGVGISSFAIFFLLTVYNRFRDGYIVHNTEIKGETSLETPNDLDSAVKTFLDKTNW